MLTIRLATSADHDAIEALWAEAQLVTVSAAEWATLLAGPAMVLLAEDECGLAGAGVASFDGWRAHIYHVAVDPLSRHRGVATAIMADAETRLRRLGARTIHIEVRETNARALALTARAGYEVATSTVLLIKDIEDSEQRADEVPVRRRATVRRRMSH